MEVERLLSTSVEDINIKTYTRDYILNSIVCGIGNVRWGFKVLILDQTSMKFIDSAVEMNDITKAGVSDVCMIDRDRLPLSKLDGIYLVCPSKSNVQQIIADFGDEAEPKYKRVHLFFTSRVPDDLMRNLAQAQVMARIKTLKEINLQYLVYDSLVFHFNTPHSLFHLYSSLGSQPAEQKEIAERLASVMATLGEYPIIRFGRFSANCSAIASHVYDILEKFRRGGSLKSSGTRGTLLILDRTHDLVSPIIHDLHYQSMIEDILSSASSTISSEKVHSDVYCYKYKDGENQEQPREVILNEKDPIWCEIRDMHIETAKNWITLNFKKFREEHSDIGKGHDLTKQLKAMPKFQTLKAKFSVHISLAKECMDVYNRSGLSRICSVEQDLSTGLDEYNKKIVGTPDDLKPLLNDNNVSKENKQRLLMLHYLVNPKAAETRSALEGGAMLTEAEERILTNWLTLKEQTTKTNHQRPPASQQEWEFVVSRYTPILNDIIMSISNGSLSTKDYPYLNKEEESETRHTNSGTTQTKKKAPASNWSGTTTENYSQKKNGPRIIVFIAGGLSYPEIRIAHKLSQKPHNLDVILGSTHIVDPPRFLKQVGALNTTADNDAYKPPSILEI